MPFCSLTLKGPKPLPAQYPRELNTLGDHLWKRRLDLALLQRQVADQIGVDETTVTNWEGQRTAPALPCMPRIVEFLGYALYDPAAPLGRRLRACRESLGLTQREVAGLLGVDSSSVRDWETGRRKPIRNYRARIVAFLVAPVSLST